MSLCVTSTCEGGLQGVVHVKQTSAAPPLLTGSLLSIHIRHGMRHGIMDTTDLVSLGLHCFLRLAHALYCRSGRCLAGVAFFLRVTHVTLGLLYPQQLSDTRVRYQVPGGYQVGAGGLQSMYGQCAPGLEHVHARMSVNGTPTKTFRSKCSNQNIPTKTFRPNIPTKTFRPKHSDQTFRPKHSDQNIPTKTFRSAGQFGSNIPIQSVLEPIPAHHSCHRMTGHVGPACWQRRLRPMPLPLLPSTASPWPCGCGAIHAACARPRQMWLEGCVQGHQRP